jgi:F1F0 ATPase subunit 2
MSELPILALTCALGVVLGALFFGGLWWTVRRSMSATRPSLWFFGSLMLRMSVTLAGFYFVSGGRWERLVACLVGFVTASVLVTRVTRPMGEQEVGDAPYS